MFKTGLQVIKLNKMAKFSNYTRDISCSSMMITGCFIFHLTLVISIGLWLIINTQCNTIYTTNVLGQCNVTMSSNEYSNVPLLCNNETLMLLDDSKETSGKEDD